MKFFLNSVRTSVCIALAFLAFSCTDQQIEDIEPNLADEQTTFALQMADVDDGPQALVVETCDCVWQVTGLLNAPPMAELSVSPQSTPGNNGLILLVDENENITWRAGTTTTFPLPGPLRLLPEPGVDGLRILDYSYQTEGEATDDTEIVGKTLCANINGKGQVIGYRQSNWTVRLGDAGSTAEIPSSQGTVYRYSDFAPLSTPCVEIPSTKFELIGG